MGVVMAMVMLHHGGVLEIMHHSGDRHPCTPCLRDICAALLYHISLETPPELE